MDDRWTLEWMVAKEQLGRSWRTVYLPSRQMCSPPYALEAALANMRHCLDIFLMEHCIFRIRNVDTNEVIPGELLF